MIKNIYKNCFLAIAISISGVSAYAQTNESHAAAKKPTVEFYNSESHNSNLPFSESVRVGQVVFLSGQIGSKPDGTGLVKGGIKAQTRQTLLNIQSTLNGQGLGLQDIVKCTVFLADMKEWSKMNEVYIEMFKNHRPARSAFGVNGVALGGALEMECIAAVSNK
jgi:reactive intermediate/imine deaminase